MELPKRPRGDEYARPGRIAELMRRIASRPGVADIPVACFYAFDFATRTLPFCFYDKRMSPAGMRAVAAAFHEAGFKKTRAIFQLWSPYIKPSNCRIDGRPLEILAVSAMQIHSAPSYQLIEDAWSMGEHRPLILAGGPKAIYEPDHYFGLGPRGDIHADAVCTGEELILLELLDRLTEHRASGETMLQAFRRCRDGGMLDDIPGLVYMSRERDHGGRPVLIHTGIQRLVSDLDELPHVAVGFRLLEPPHRRTTLAARPLPQKDVHKYSLVAGLVTTHGCKFACSYCPIPAYNQRTWRSKSPERLVDEFRVLREDFDIHHFFGTDDNFFNTRSTVEELFTAMARMRYKDRNGRVGNARQRIRFSTEATEFDVLKCKDLLPLASEAGTFAIWFGIEDLSAELINKGQTPDKTIELFTLLERNRILPMAMMMHHDGQPLRTGGKNLYGIMNQAAFLYRHGAASFQCTLHGPAIGTKEYETTLNRGIVLRSVAGEPVPESYMDGNHVLATSHRKPARMQLNMLLAYARFYNPMHLAELLWRHSDSRRLKKKRLLLQVAGMVGLIWTAIRNLPWLIKLTGGKLDYWRQAPGAKFPMRRLDERAPHETPRLEKSPESATGKHTVISDSPSNQWTAWAGRKAPPGSTVCPPEPVPLLKVGPLRKPLVTAPSPPAPMISA